ncbi:MAG: hypothetical protein ACE5GI_09785 [Candidatus Aminicenantales bacterium]
MDAGTSSGIWGLKEGYSLMVGGDKIPVYPYPAGTWGPEEAKKFLSLPRGLKLRKTFKRRS